MVTHCISIDVSEIGWAEMKQSSQWTEDQKAWHWVLRLTAILCRWLEAAHLRPLLTLGTASPAATLPCCHDGRAANARPNNPLTFTSGIAASSWVLRPEELTSTPPAGGPIWPRCCSNPALLSSARRVHDLTLLTIEE
ncbi:hypothetical protein KGM_207900 [Danaus plexippus plexippus]|uniref:Uncharacterized protein n=1 Tax=Danaus plexippus plexippus TaxID=278856 RepID=A0A212FF88_DANPL|nr:hypothetical protein KGM_207900 [Danaus plexippus plexippus]